MIVTSFCFVASRLLRKEMVQKCILYGCNNTKDEKKGISIHQIPIFNDLRSEAFTRYQNAVNTI